MKQLKHLKDPLILFFILILTAGVIAAASGGDDAGTSRDGFGSDTDDAGNTSDSDSSTTSDTTRSSFGDDTDDEGSTDSNTSSQDSTNSDTETTSNDASSSDFGNDTDDSGSSRDSMGNDTDDEGSSKEGFGDDTDDEGSSRDGFGNESETTDDDQEDNQTEQTKNKQENQTKENKTDGNDDKYRYNPPTVTVKETDNSENTEDSGVTIRSVSWPDSVEAGKSFQVCADVYSETTPDVTLYKDGNPVRSKTQEGTVCFNTQLEEGKHRMKVKATVPGDSAQDSAVVRAYSSNSRATGGFLDSMSTGNLAILGIILVGLAVAGGILYRRRR